jgi:hypothetical protein
MSLLVLLVQSDLNRLTKSAKIKLSWRRLALALHYLGYLNFKHLINHITDKALMWRLTP